MFVVKSEVKKYLNKNGKQIGKDSIDVLDMKVKKILDNAIKNSKHFKRVSVQDIWGMEVKS